MTTATATPPVESVSSFIADEAGVEQYAHEPTRAEFRRFRNFVRKRYGVTLSRRGGEWHMRCPFHEDKHPSLRINDRKAVWYCDPCGKGGSIVGLVSQREGITRAQAIALLRSHGVHSDQPNLRLVLSSEGGKALPVPSDATDPPTLPGFQTRFAYRDGAGHLLSFLDRIETKQGKLFLPWSWGKTGWQKKALPKPRPLYGLELLATEQERPVLVVEGEKTADAGRSRYPEYVVVTSANGSSAAASTDWSPLKGREVIIWPDNDDAGRSYANDVARRAHEAGAASVRLVQFDAAIRELLPTGWDVADSLPATLTSDQTKHVQGALSGALECAVLYSLGSADSEQGSQSSAIQCHGAQRIELLAADIVRAIDEAHDLSIVRARVATLLPAEQGRLLKLAAKQYGCSIGDMRRTLNVSESADPAASRPSARLSFEDVDPWEEPVDGAALLDSLVEYFERYLVLPERGGDLLALFSMFSHVFDCFDVSPRLYLSSPERQCGKSQTLRLLGYLVARPLQASSVTSAAIFRAIDRFQPTMMIDEFDNSAPRERGEPLAILNSGHERSSAVVIRSVGEDHDPVTFSTWAVYIFAGIVDARLPDTLRSRCIELPLRRKLTTESRARIDRATAREGAELSRKIARWAADNADSLEATFQAGGVRRDLELLPNDRMIDNWEPLLAIAGVVGGTWPPRAREAAKCHSKIAVEAKSLGTMLLEDLRRVFQEAPGRPGCLSTKEILARLTCEENAERPWCTWRDGSPLDERALARLLRQYGVRSGNVRPANGAQAKGYELADLEESFRCYLEDVSVSARAAARDDGPDLDPVRDAGTSGTLVTETGEPTARQGDETKPLDHHTEHSVQQPLPREEPGRSMAHGKAGTVGAADALIMKVVKMVRRAK